MFEAEFQEHVRNAIPAIAKGPKKSHSDVHVAVIGHPSRLAGYVFTSLSGGCVQVYL